MNLQGLPTGGGRCRAEGSSATADGGQAATSFTPDPDGIHLHIFESFKLVVLYVALYVCMYVCMYSACYIPDITYEEGTINLPFLLMRQLIYRHIK